MYKLKCIKSQYVKWLSMQVLKKFWIYFTNMTLSFFLKGKAIKNFVKKQLQINF